MKHVRVFPTNQMATKRTNHDQDQRHKYYHLTRPFHLTLKMTTAQVVETSVNTLQQSHSHMDDHTTNILIIIVKSCTFTINCNSVCLLSLTHQHPHYDSR